MAYTRTMLSHNGNVRRDSLEESAFMAFSISMTTKLQAQSTVETFLTQARTTYIESEMVEAAFALSLANISHPISGNFEEH